MFSESILRIHVVYNRASGNTQLRLVYPAFAQSESDCMCASPRLQTVHASALFCQLKQKVTTGYRLRALALRKPYRTSYQCVVYWECNTLNSHARNRGNVDRTTLERNGIPRVPHLRHTCKLIYHNNCTHPNRVRIRASTVVGTSNMCSCSAHVCMSAARL